MCEVSIIIVNYNTCQLTYECIQSIIKYTRGVSYEIILVDNGSTDGSNLVFNKLDNILFIQNKTNLGFGIANNIGYTYATGKYVFLLNSDTLLYNDAVSIFYESMERMPSNVACIGCMLHNKDRTIGYSYGKFLSIKQMFRNALILISGKKKYQGKVIKKCPFFVDVILGADMFIRNAVIQDVIFDKRYFMYNEENDFQRSLAKQGFKNMIIDGPDIVHLGGASDFGNVNQHIASSSFMYIKKWHNMFYYYTYRILYALFYIPRIVMSGKLTKANKQLISLILFDKI